MSKKNKYSDIELQEIRSHYQELVDALRTVIACSGALKYAAFENLLPVVGKLKSIDPTLKSPQVLDLKKDIEKIISLSEKVNSTIQLRFVDVKSQELYENISYGIFLCNHALSVKPENEVYQYAFDISGNKKNYALLSEQIKFFDNVLNKARSSNHDALRMIQERRDTLETINAQPILIKEDGNVQVFDIAPEREEVENCTV